MTLLALLFTRFTRAFLADSPAPTTEAHEITIKDCAPLRNPGATGR